MGKGVIIACDFPDVESTLNFLNKFNNEQLFVKIGMELFYAEGPEIIKKVKDRGHKIFLDLKLHDIPNTVKSAMAVLSRYDVDMINVHAVGTIKMMQAAVEGIDQGKEDGPKIIAVTQLTSTSEDIMQNELLISGTMSDVVVRYAKNAKEAGLDGVVCSPLEAGVVKDNCGKNFLAVTPGVRFASDSHDDQARFTTPKMAKEYGSDYIVVGRSITGANDPQGAYKKCCDEFID